jgi:hypothetical protein
LSEVCLIHTVLQELGLFWTSGDGLSLYRQISFCFHMFSIVISIRCLVVSMLA